MWPKCTVNNEPSSFLAVNSGRQSREWSNRTLQSSLNARKCSVVQLLKSSAFLSCYLSCPGTRAGDDEPRESHKHSSISSLSPRPSTTLSFSSYIPLQRTHSFRAFNTSESPRDLMQSILFFPWSTLVRLRACARDNSLTLRHLYSHSPGVTTAAYCLKYTESPHYFARDSATVLRFVSRRFLKVL